MADNFCCTECGEYFSDDVWNDDDICDDCSQRRDEFVSRGL